MPKVITDFHKNAVDCINATAHGDGKFALISTTRIDTGEEVIVLARIEETDDKKSWTVFPLAMLFDDDPGLTVAPPMQARQ